MRFTNFIAVTAALIHTSVSQTSDNYTSSSIVLWDRPRGSQIRYDVYIDGGSASYADGSSPKDPNGRLVKLSLNNSFNVHDSNSPAVFDYVGYGSNVNPRVDGHMFADYYEFYAWGGMPFEATPDSAVTMWKQIYNATADPNAQDSIPVSNSSSTPTNEVTYTPEPSDFKMDFVTSGAGVNVPSERLGFYFNGYWFPNDTQLSFPNSPGTNYTNQLIKVDMSDPGAAVWTNSTLPANIAPRLEGALVWVPVGEQGLLVAIGGVADAEDIVNGGLGLNSTETNDTSVLSPIFLTEFPVYDIKNQQWYTQKLNTGSSVPSTSTGLANFCAVVASAENGSSHEIFIHGGWPSTTPTDQVSDEVWILTVPAFEWVRASASRTGRGRIGHLCVNPYPDQMMIIGGTTVDGQPLSPGDTLVDVYNLNSLNWTGTWDPTVHNAYQPPAVVTAITSKTQFADSMPSNLTNLFKTNYTGAIRQYNYVSPTTPAPPSNSTVPPPPAPHHRAGYVVPLAATLGTVGGLAIIALILFCCWRHRRNQRNKHRKSMTKSESDARSGKVSGWLAASNKGVQSTDTTEIGAPSSPGPAPGFEGKPELDANSHEMSTYMSPDSNRATFNSNNPYSPPFRTPASYGPIVEGADTPVHEADSHAVHNPLDQIVSYDLRNNPHYPPSVLSAGHTGPSGPSEIGESSISGPSSNRDTAEISGGTPTSAKFSNVISRKPHPMSVGSIPEGSIATTDGPSPDDSSPAARGPIGSTIPEAREPGTSREAGGVAGPLEPAAEHPAPFNAAVTTRPSHRRNASSISSTGLPMREGTLDPNEEDRRSMVIDQLPEDHDERTRAL